MTTLQQIALIVAMFGGLCGVVTSVYAILYTRKRNQAQDLTKIFEGIDGRFEKITFKVDDLTGRVQQVEVKISPFWQAMERMAIEKLHHPDTPDIDELLDKYKHDWVDNRKPKIMTKEDAARLLIMLKTLIRNDDARRDLTAEYVLAAALQARYGLTEL